MPADDIVIVAARRTPIGAFLGRFADLAAPELGGAAIRAALADSTLGADAIDELLLGCVLSAGLGQAPARRAAQFAGLPVSIPCTAVNKVCGSGMKAVMLGHDTLRAGTARAVIAGGMESMSNAPYLITRARRGLRMGHGELVDHMFFDGLENAADGRPMGWFAEQCAERFGIGREEQDAYAIESVRRSQAACNSGAFAAELVPVTVPGKQGVQLHEQDEIPFRCDVSRIPKLKPAFRDGGTVTAASSASISDGAAALVLMRAGDARRQGIRPLARIAGCTGYALAPDEFTIAPIHAIAKLIRLTGWSAADIDLYEINEAFAAVVLAAVHELKLDRGRVNVNGGGCALGHPIGASGARIVVTLVHALRNRGLRRGIAALCIGGGEATALAVECL